MLSETQKVNNIRRNINRIRKSFKSGATQLSSQIRDEAIQSLQTVSKVPKWVRVLSKIYHDYGLKHICLILILVAYQFLGAGIFYFCEVSYDENKENTWIEEIKINRTKLINDIIPSLFNNSEYLFFLTENQTKKVFWQLNDKLIDYEKQLGIKYTDQKIKWDFWNAMLYAQTICTTIGYGFTYTNTRLGKIATILYAILGIPLVLSVLDDFGKLLTKFLKYPWLLFKCGCRRAFRYFTKQTMEEIKKLDEEDKLYLEVFDMPIIVAIGIVVAWIFICSATFCIWERDWDYFVAFYFFFISLSTIGLGDIRPTQPKYLSILFIYIIIGLSLVSMCINLIQSKIEKTYEGGSRIYGGEYSLHGNQNLDSNNNNQLRIKTTSRRGSSLGIFKSSEGSSLSICREQIQLFLNNKQKSNKGCQTMLSFPNYNYNTNIIKSVSQEHIKYIPKSLSIEDVMKLVDNEEGNIYLLSDGEQEENQFSDECDNNKTDSETHIVISKSFDVNFAPILSLDKYSIPSLSKVGNRMPTLYELEAIEEMEDKIILQNLLPKNDELTPDSQNLVHFRSRLSLIPEQKSIVSDESSFTLNNDKTEDDTSDKEIESIKESMIKNSNTPPVSPKKNKLTHISNSRSFSKFFKSIFHSNYSLNNATSEVNDKYEHEGSNSEFGNTITSLKIDKK
ncbi:Potassium channel subfamily K member 18 [Strongyloides ratti]|uniref:Potassium channel subfamily K member 18 n=1 Tax=Strongyloides ratti TaxID=34506 RepID=A0A090L4F3_STRRB|nr:Potassium channel subfamily K member 18 [Strongyloides ratti]CEF63002.1 Potassium channel subfamily K member 18 [Strongyloides ratti]